MFGCTFSSMLMLIRLQGNIILDYCSLIFRQTLKIDICRSLASFMIIFILQTQQKLIDQPDLITVSLVQKPQPALFYHLLGF